MHPRLVPAYAEGSRSTRARHPGQRPAEAGDHAVVDGCTSLAAANAAIALVAPWHSDADPVSHTRRETCRHLTTDISRLQGGTCLARRIRSSAVPVGDPRDTRGSTALDRSASAGAVLHVANLETDAAARTYVIARFCTPSRPPCFRRAARPSTRAGAIPPPRRRSRRSSP